MHRSNGFSLVELMVTLAVAAILLAAATPSMADFIRSNRVAAGSNALVAAMQVARAESIRRGVPMTLCVSDDPAAATPACNAGNDWTGKTLVLVSDSAVSGNPAPTALIQAFDLDDQRLALTAPNAYVRFLASGEVQTGANIEVAFTLVPDGCTNEQQRQVFLSRMGRVRTVRLSCP